MNTDTANTEVRVLATKGDLVTIPAHIDWSLPVDAILSYWLRPMVIAVKAKIDELPK